MEIYNKLPEDVSHKMFMYFAHPVAELVKFHHRSASVSALMKDIRDYPESLKRLYKLPFAKDHAGAFGRASLLNRLWINLRDCHRSYYRIWERLYCIKSRERAEHFIGNYYAVHPHKFQIEFLWKLSREFKVDPEHFTSNPHTQILS